MQYMLLIYENEGEARGRTEEEKSKMFAEYRGFTTELRSSGKMLSGQPLERSRSIKSSTRNASTDSGRYEYALLCPEIHAPSRGRMWRKYDR